MRTPSTSWAITLLILGIAAAPHAVAESTWAPFYDDLATEFDRDTAAARVAQSDAGDATAARRSVLRALEIAPNYDVALELLLELRGTGAPTR